MRKWSLVLSALAILSACTPTTETNPSPDLGAQFPKVVGESTKLRNHRPFALSAELQARVKLGAIRYLKDPTSAMFGPMRAAEEIGSTTGFINVCGYMNAKNSYGGYTGMQPFFGMLNLKPAYGPGFALFGQGRSAKSVCEMYGIYI